MKTEQNNLFATSIEPPAPVGYRKHIDTSVEGAEHAKVDSERQLSDYLDRLKRTGHVGMTDNEAARLMVLPSSTVSARRNGGIQRGLVVYSGKKRKDPITGVGNRIYLHIDFAGERS
ncbi:MAG: hypothetical protein AAGC72_11135 [Planctomycetota bacterium]